ncbi:MAG: hypothetical protein EAZ81_07390 [Verrucomicrobia bacterium]|nr:MAG: hypothetical protein EAZ81_07390 [Verrucomicrobiota bacterium]
MKKSIKETITISAFLWIAWEGVNGNEGCARIIQFWAFIMSATIVFAISKEAREKHKNMQAGLPIAIHHAFHLVALGLFVYHGWILTAVAFFAYMLGISSLTAKNS